MSEDITKYIAPDEEEFGSIRLRKPTAGTLSLCDFAKLKITSGGVSEVPFFEAIAFFYIHSKPISDVKKVLFDKSKGYDTNGCSLAFTEEVINWGDSVELGTIGEMGGKIGELLTEAMSPSVEPTDKKEKVEEVSAIISNTESKKKE